MDFGQWACEDGPWCLMCRLIIAYSLIPHKINKRFGKTMLNNGHVEIT